MECPSGEVHGDAPPIDRMCPFCGNLLSIHPEVLDDDTGAILYECGPGLWISADKVHGKIVAASRSVSPKEAS